jgi:hypothetical protein
MAMRQMKDKKKAALTIKSRKMGGPTPIQRLIKSRKIVGKTAIRNFTKQALKADEEHNKRTSKAMKGIQTR